MKTLIDKSLRGKTVNKRKVSDREFKRYLRTSLFKAQALLDEVQNNITINSPVLAHKDILMNAIEELAVVRDINKRSWKKA